MESLRDYEKKVLRFLISDLFTTEELSKIISECRSVSYDYTGAGYYLEISHPDLPKHRIVRDKPIVIGESKGITSGFVVFIENNQLTIECYSWCESDLPEYFRDDNVRVRAVTIEDGKFVDLKS